MTILLFLVDTSASMAASSYMGLTYLEHARGLVGNIRKAREQMKGADRYMLITTEEYPLCVKAGFREGSQIFEQSVNNLRPHGKFHLGHAVLNSLKYINTHRAATGQDQFGLGRWFSLQNDNVVIVVITDSLGASSLPDDFPIIFNGRHPAGEFMEEAFRWDQRVFSVVLRLPSTHRPSGFDVTKKIEPDVSPLDRLCRQTGGRSWSLYSHEQSPFFVQQFMGVMSISGAVLRFEAYQHRNGLQDDKSLSTRLERRPLSMIYIKNSGAIPQIHWPFPESFSSQTLDTRSIPARRANPTIYVQVQPTDTAHYFMDVPFDRYEVEAGPLTEYMIEYMTDKQQTQSQLGWMVYVKNSSRHEGLGKPFGYLKVASTLQSVSLFVLPYNYPALLPLFDEIKKNIVVKSNTVWQEKLATYLKTVPLYYLVHLRKHFRRFNVPPELFEQQCSIPPFNGQITYSIKAYRDAAKREFDDVNAKVQHQNVTPTIAQLGFMPVVTSIQRMTPVLPRLERCAGRWKLKKDGENRKTIVDPDVRLPTDDLQTEQEEGPKLTVRDALINRQKESMFKNPLIIKRTELIQTLISLHENYRQSVTDQQSHFLQGGKPGTLIRLQNAAEIHDQPVSMMGMYEEYIKELTNAGFRPREIDGGSTSVGFGNPFAKKNLGNFGVDEVMESPNTGTGSSKDPTQQRREKIGKFDRQHRHRTRKTGPLPWNALKSWRERRKTISDRSSIVSDISYTSDVTDTDVEMEETSSMDSVETNGKRSLSGLEENGVLSPDEDEQDHTPSSPKKIALERRSSTENGSMRRSSIQQGSSRRKERLEDAELRDALTKATEIVKKASYGRFNIEETTKKVSTIAYSLHDRHRIVAYAARTADQCKRNDLAKALLKEEDHLVKQILKL
ncbi:unnamed protein product, partial [Mesorhabditis belari]|uniref:VWFA domain-containing protein n=1 Tax=Mesorhabditis belari TaxID=2138241 RepID=A0AAF3ECM2_9BILA